MFYVVYTRISNINKRIVLNENYSFINITIQISKDVKNRTLHNMIINGDKLRKNSVIFSCLCIFLSSLN